MSDKPIDQPLGSISLLSGQSATLAAAVTDVVKERLRQMTEIGWSPAQDDACVRSELARVAASYLCRTDGLMLGGSRVWPKGWDFKPDQYRNALVKACAMALAEIERFDRLQSGRVTAAAYPVHSFINRGERRSDGNDDA